MGVHATTGRVVAEHFADEKPAWGSRTAVRLTLTMRVALRRDPVMVSPFEVKAARRGGSVRK
jgi:hypothetical protein